MLQCILAGQLKLAVYKNYGLVTVHGRIIKHILIFLPTSEKLCIKWYEFLIKFNKSNYQRKLQAIYPGAKNNCFQLTTIMQPFKDFSVFHQNKLQMATPKESISCYLYILIKILLFIWQAQQYQFRQRSKSILEIYSRNSIITTITHFFLRHFVLLPKCLWCGELSGKKLPECCYFWYYYFQLSRLDICVARQTSHVMRLSG